MTEQDRQWHESYKPSWGPGDILLYAIPGKVGISQQKSTNTDTIMKHRKSVLVSQGKDIRFARLAVTLNVSFLCSANTAQSSTRADDVFS